MPQPGTMLPRISAINLAKPFIKNLLHSAIITFIFLTEKKRGIGGIFFDQLQHKSIEHSLDLLEEISKTYIDTYQAIINNHKKDKFSQDDRDFQLYRRGRYVEFNLLFDRGTKFGIESNGRVESILASLPPSVNWPFKLSPSIKAQEKKLLRFLNNNWDQHI